MKIYVHPCVPVWSERTLNILKRFIIKFGEKNHATNLYLFMESLIYHIRTQ